MVSLTFIAEHWVSLIFGLISAGALAYCRLFYTKLQEVEAYKEEQAKEETEAMIEEKVAPIKDLYEEAMHKIVVIRDSYKYRLIELCKNCLEKGYISTQEYSQLSEMWKLYHDGLGGNGQAEDYYHKATKLPIKEKKEEVD